MVNVLHNSRGKGPRRTVLLGIYLNFYWWLLYLSTKRESTPSPGGSWWLQREASQKVQRNLEKVNKWSTKTNLITFRNPFPRSWPPFGSIETAFKMNRSSTQAEFQGYLFEIRATNLFDLPFWEGQSFWPTTTSPRNFLPSLLVLVPASGCAKISLISSGVLKIEKKMPRFVWKSCTLR